MTAAFRACCCLLFALSLSVAVASCGGGKTTPSGDAGSQPTEQSGSPAAEQTGGQETPRPGGGGKPSVNVVSLPIGGGVATDNGARKCVTATWRGDDIPQHVRVIVSDPTFSTAGVFGIDSGSRCEFTNCLGLAMTASRTTCSVAVVARHNGTTDLTLRGHVECGQASTTECTKFTKNLSGFSVTTLTWPDSGGGDNGGGNGGGGNNGGGSSQPAETSMSETMPAPAITTTDTGPTS